MLLACYFVRVKQTMKGNQLSAVCCCLLRVLIILYVWLPHSYSQNGGDGSQKVMYVTGCLGSDAVTLHKATSARGVRAVFVYKGSEILGSDIIPAQGDFKGRLQINRQGEVILSDLHLTDSGVFRVEMAKRDSKTSTHVILVLPEAPTTQGNKLQVRETRFPPGSRIHSRLTCGKFTSLGYPPATVLWKDPDGRLLSSSGQSDGEFYVDITETSPGGNYSCLLHCHTPETCCLPPRSKLLQSHAHAIVSPPSLAAFAPVTSSTHFSSNMTAVLRKTGKDMAVAMAALVNDQMQDTMQKNRDELEAWKAQLEAKIERRLSNARRMLETVTAPTQPRAAGGRNENVRVDAGRGTNNNRRNIEPTAVDAPNENSRLESDYFIKVETSLRAIQRQMTESQKNMTKLHRTVDGQMTNFEKKLKTVKRNLRKYGVWKHLELIEGLTEQMREQFGEVHEKFNNYQLESQVSDDNIYSKLQQTLEEINTRMNRGQTDVDNVLDTLTYKVEGLQLKVSTMEDQLRTHKAEHASLSLPGDNVDSGINVISADRETNVDRRREQTASVPRENANRFFEQTTVPTQFRGQLGERVSRNVSYATSESCLEARRNGGSLSGPYPIRVDGVNVQNLWCDMKSAGGGWLVIQRRQDGSVDFFRPWNEYVQGFGDPGSRGEFWLGLELLHKITNRQPHSLRIDLRTFDGQEGVAFYRHFRILGVHQKYLMSAHGYTGTVGDSLIVHDNKKFSTWDEDNDNWQDGHCAKNYRSAWWYARCRISDLNAPYSRGPEGIMWLYGNDSWGAGKIAFVEMKIRPE